MKHNDFLLTNSFFFAVRAKPAGHGMQRVLVVVLADFSR